MEEIILKSGNDLDTAIIGYASVVAVDGQVLRHTEFEQSVGADQAGTAVGHLLLVVEHVDHRAQAVGWIAGILETRIYYFDFLVKPGRTISGLVIRVVVNRERGDRRLLTPNGP